MKPWKLWAIFSLSAVLLAGAAAWLALQILELENVQREAEHRDEVDDRVMRALWRMEYAVVPLIIQEAARPYYHYSAFFYPEGLKPILPGVPVEDGLEMESSPLLNAFVPYTLLHFALHPDGELHSPQVPTGDQKILAVDRLGDEFRFSEAANRLRQLREIFRRESLQRTIIREEEADRLGGSTLAEGSKASLLRSLLEYRARRNSLEQARLLANNQQFVSHREIPTQALGQAVAMRPFWSGSDLFLARHFLIDGQPYVQGCWLNLRAIEERLMSEIEDLLPGASVVPAPVTDEGSDGLRLASLPFRLLPGDVPQREPPFMSPIRISLLLALCSLLLAAVAVAFLLRVILAFNERRGAFVSAVTHELRTPLTTLSMYTDLLAEGRIQGEEKRQKYLETMRQEAERLGHLVGNVLTYSQLEASGKISDRTEVLEIQEVLKKVESRSLDHARKHGMDLSVLEPGELAKLRVIADVSALEQVIFNLVDNACKYAADSDDRRLIISVARTRQVVEIQVRDHGPGITVADSSRLFRPFSKSMNEAARGKPGVGLGLSLSRGLVRSMGGDLRLDPTWTEGAGFVVEIPIA